MSASGSAPIRVALDAMGGDNAPAEIVLGAVQAAREYGIGVYLVGQEVAIRAELAKHDTTGLDLPIIHTDEVIEMDDHPATTVRRKKNASMVLALQLVRDGKALGAVSAGNSGAMMAASLFTLKRIPGVDRPALGGVFATKNSPCMVIDMGANTDCKPEYLQQFALMGSIYMERIFKISSPRVGLLANGEEETKGNQQVIETHQLLKKDAALLGLNFIGNVEGRDIPTNAVDIVVCDGFVGNILLKSSEGLATMIGARIEALFKQNLLTMAVGALALPLLKRLRADLAPARHNGASFLGLQGIVVKSHGSASVVGFQSAIQRALIEIQENLPQRTSGRLEALL